MAAWNETGGGLRFGVKPEVPRINYAHPLARGLVFCIDYALGTNGAQTHRDIVGNIAGAYAGTAPNTGPHGWERTFLGSTDSDKYTGLAAAAQNAHKLTFEFLFKGNIDTFMALVNKSTTASPGTASFFGIFWDDTAHCLSMSAGFSTTDGGWRDTNAVFVPNKFTHVVVTYDDTSLSNVPAIYWNGQSQPVTISSTAAGTRIADDGDLQVGNFQTQAFGASADISYMRMWNRALTPGEVAALYSNPWQIYVGPLKSTATNLPPVVWNLSCSESGSAADTASALMIFQAALAELGSAADNPSAQMVMVAAANENGSAADVPSAQLVTTSAVNESGAAAETESMALTISVTVAESGAAAEVETVKLTQNPSVSESGAAADIESAQLNFGAAITEAGASLDAPGAQMIIGAAVSESGAAADSESTKLTISPSVSESGSAAESESAQLVTTNTVSETGNASDTESQVNPGGLSVAETGNAVDTTSVQMIMAAAVSETGAAADVSAAAMIIGAVVSESASAIDAMSVAMALALGVVEAGSALDISSTNLAMSLVVTEFGAALDISSTPDLSVRAIKCNTLRGPDRVRLVAGAGRIRLLKGLGRVRLLVGECC